jgi:hypothetical protein
VYFPQPVPADAQWYKYDPDRGWSVYEHAVFNNSRTAITISLEDGGEGDEDGVVNGIIIDPSGLGYRAQSISTPDASDAVSNADASGGGGCFISIATKNVNVFGLSKNIYCLGILALFLIVGLVGEKYRHRKTDSLR